MSSQAWATAQDWVPTIGVFKAVTYGQSDVNLDIVKIVEGSHPMVAGATDSSLSNFASSAHSSFNDTGVFLCQHPPMRACTHATRRVRFEAGVRGEEGAMRGLAAGC